MLYIIMLTALTIRNLALIDTLELAPKAGFTVLTGETGAGKSMVLDALDLALGGRADAGLMRAGEAVCEVVATFEGPATQTLQAVLEEQGIEGDGEWVLRRQLKADNGKLVSRAWLNGTPVPVGALAGVGACVVDIHSQHGTMALTTPAAQRGVVDAFHGDAPAVTAVASTHDAWHTAQHELALSRAATAKAFEDAELRAAWLKELKQLNYHAGEEDKLAHQRAQLANAAQLAQLLSTVDAALNDDAGTLATLAMASRALHSAAGLNEGLTGLAGRVESALTDLRDAAYDIARSAHGGEGEMSLEEIDDRLHALKACARKHGCTVAELPDMLARLQAEDAMAVAGGEQVEALAAAERKARGVFEAACQALTYARTACLPNLHTQLHAALKDLLMPHARVEVQLTTLPPDSWNGEGAETITFLLAANPGQPAQPMAKVASGGELSRLMLALKTVFYAALPPQTIILDEIDTGLSGAAAHAVGQAMARLAQRHQVIAITHHAQVAALAQHHWQVAKHTAGGTTTSSVAVLTTPARTDEVARLLSGATITEAARAAARELMAA
ncbi:MAG: DNA repair protein RecN [Alphaproteobacteria bacterium]